MVFRTFDHEIAAHSRLMRSPFSCVVFFVAIDCPSFSDVVWFDNAFQDATECSDPGFSISECNRYCFGDDRCLAWEYVPATGSALVISIFLFDRLLSACAHLICYKTVNLA